MIKSRVNYYIHISENSESEKHNYVFVIDNYRKIVRMKTVCYEYLKM